MTVTALPALALPGAAAGALACPRSGDRVPRNRGRAAAPFAYEVALYDPVPMRLARKAGWERAQLLVESARRPSLQQFLDRWVPGLYALRHPAELRWHLDVDPIEF